MAVCLPVKKLAKSPKSPPVCITSLRASPSLILAAAAGSSGVAVGVGVAVAVVVGVAVAVGVGVGVDAASSVGAGFCVDPPLPPPRPRRPPRVLPLARVDVVVCAFFAFFAARGGVISWRCPPRELVSWEVSAGVCWVAGTGLSLAR